MCIKQSYVNYRIPGMNKKIGMFVALLHVTRAWDNTYLLPNVPIDRWSHVRKSVIDAQGSNAKILDVGCGLGFSTSDTPGSLGIDVNREAIEKAHIMFPQKEFRLGVVGSWNHDIQYDVSTCMFYLHTIPKHMRERVIDTAKNTATKRVVIVDVCPEFQPNEYVLLEKPYLQDYLETCRDDLSGFKESVLVEGHIHQWELEFETDTASDTASDTLAVTHGKNKVIDDETFKQILRFYRPL